MLSQKEIVGMGYRPLTQYRAIPTAPTGRWIRRFIILACFCFLTSGLPGGLSLGLPNLYAAETIEPFESSGVIDAYSGDTIVINDTALRGFLPFHILLRAGVDL